MNLKMLIDTFQKETEGWNHMLECIIKENINLKIRLAGILTGRNNQPQYLESAEAYQTRFIQYDDIIGLIRKDIVEFQNALTAFTYDVSMVKEFVDRKSKLQREIISLRVAFNELKQHFIEYCELHELCDNNEKRNIL